MQDLGEYQSQINVVLEPELIAEIVKRLPEVKLDAELGVYTERIERLRLRGDTPLGEEIARTAIRPLVDAVYNAAIQRARLQGRQLVHTVELGAEDVDLKALSEAVQEGRKNYETRKRLREQQEAWNKIEAPKTLDNMTKEEREEYNSLYNRAHKEILTDDELKKLLERKKELIAMAASEERKIQKRMNELENTIEELKRENEEFRQKKKELEHENEQLKEIIKRWCDADKLPQVPDQDTIALVYKAHEVMEEDDC
ncbi:MAG: hypothetical protein APZ16_04540 [Candidatus Hadarchaeum yellowstonense]|uniref:Uncharacterized protein n=1 Tax=Hadarchaeum yellowstonense TaxID=1776334 RepID=A0A147JW27_HADYE|nr:MAG: hypothetical protein APZ16_04540 [Candidatus Hadarchaeum yellowstonense]